MLLTEKVLAAMDLEAIKKFGLQKQAEKLICKILELYLKDKQKFHTFAFLLRNFKAITSEDAHIVLTEMEHYGMIMTKILNKKLVYKYNEDITRFTHNSTYNVELAVKLREQAKEKFKKKLEKARRFVNDNSEVTKEVSDTHLEILEEGTTKTVLERHLSKECDSSNCRFCLFEQNKEFDI